jgi:hypothetical protein
MKRIKYIFGIIVILFCVFTNIRQNVIGQRLTRIEQRNNELDSILTQWVHESKGRRFSADSTLRIWTIEKIHRDSVWKAYDARQKAKGKNQ